uniref:F-box protein 47 n=1 Tax=Jaculus jaculus TaxID=51337 RepID=A0A8C5NW25_JACJA
MASKINTSFTSLPTQKCRRTNQSSSFSSTAVSNPQLLSTLGNFKVLPLEIFHLVLRCLSVKDIGMLSMVSKAVNQHIINYTSTSSGSKRLLLQDFHNPELPNTSEDSDLLGYYRALALTAGWDELECHRVYNFLCELTSLPRRMQTVVCNKPGQVIWREMIDAPTDESSMKGLADAIKLLYDTGTKEWTADDVISLVDELSVVPREWLLENNARLLIQSGNNICFTFMASKAVNGRAIELARLIVFLALVCEKELYCMDWTVKMMQKVCKVFSTAVERNNFLESVANAFTCVTMEMLQPVIYGDHNEDDNVFLNLFHLLHAQANFHKEVLYLTMSTLSS